MISQRQLDPRPPWRDGPDWLWVGLADCGCLMAWSLSHPRELAPDHQWEASGPGRRPAKWLFVRFSLAHGEMHNTIEGESWDNGILSYKGSDYMDWSLGGCPGPERQIQYPVVMSEWFYPEETQ